VPEKMKIICIDLAKMECYVLLRRGIPYVKWNRGRPIWLVTSCLAIAFWNTLL